MFAQTYPIHKTEPQLQTLVKQARTTGQPVILTSEETAQPIAVVMEIDTFEQTQRYQQQLFSLQIRHLENWLDRVEQSRADETVREACVNAWKENIKFVWDVAPEAVRTFAASLILATQKLVPEQLTQAQLSALRHSLTLLT